MNPVSESTVVMATLMIMFIITVFGSASVYVLESIKNELRKMNNHNQDSSQQTNQNIQEPS